MKRQQLKIWLLFMLAGAIFAACEGPQGIAGLNGEDGANGTDGTDGTDGNSTCLACHAGETKDNIDAQFAMSAHNEGKAVSYSAYGSSCASCHSHQGFVQFANTGKVGDITNPTAWECATCHGLHKTMEATDYALRLSAPVTSISEDTKTMDLGGNSNLCANCHQSRRAAPTVAEGETDFEIPQHYGPHHGPQANILSGFGLAEISGPVAYPAAGTENDDHLKDASCTGCHMAAFQDDEDQGGHSFKPSQNACNSCHETTDTGFEHKGNRASFEIDLESLRQKLFDLGVVTGNEDDGYHVVEEVTIPFVHAQAAFNWIALNEDSSHGAHNPVYINAILKNSIAALE